MIKSSIIDQVKKEFYEKGRDDEKDHQAQLSMSRYDEEFEKGRQDAWEDAPSRFTWFSLGILFTGFMVALVLQLID